MSQATDPPNYTDFNTEFNYAVWTADTVITLTNVPWNNDYRDIVKFANRAALDSYINASASTNTQIDDSSYARVSFPVKLDIPFDKAFKYNYLRAANPAQPIAGSSPQSFYYFITDVRYNAPNTTEIIVQLDLWQTFGYDITLGNSFIERGHIGIANSKNFDNYGRDYLTIPEGLDTGGEYQIIDKSSIYLGTPDVLVASTVDLTADPGTVAAPLLHSARGSVFSGMPSGAEYYVFSSMGSFLLFMANNSGKPWITQGIISITLIPRVSIYWPGFVYGASGEPVAAPEDKPIRISKQMKTDWRNDADILNSIPVRHRYLRKFFTYPYMVLELTTWTGTPIVLKPESWADDDATVTERLAVIPPNQRIVYVPRRYNALPTSTVESDAEGYKDDSGEYLDFATMIANFPTFAIVNNMAVGYLAQNAHGIAFQNQAADWSQQKALRGNEVSYDQASSGIELANQLGITSRNADILQTGLHNNAIGASAIMGSLGGVGGGAVSGMVGGPAGAAIGGVGAATGGIMGNLNTMHQQRVNNDSLAIRNAAASQSNADSMGNSRYIRDTNKNLADYAAKGDYENTIAGINARVQDARLTQPTTSGQLGGETMNLINGEQGISLRIKMIDQAHIRAIGDYWLRYGYAVNQFATIPASLMVMTKFTYWKLSETYIQAGNMPESFKQAIRGIFEKGVTVWGNPADIGTNDWGQNAALGGITL